MNVLILGVDGYIGWPLALRLLKRGHMVYGVDSFFTRRRVKEVHSDSVLPIEPFSIRNKKLHARMQKQVTFFRGDVSDAKFMYDVVEASRPDVIVHLAEQRSAPYSMIGLKQATETMVKNIVSTLNLIYAVKDIVPEAHILKMGTMGEYGTPNIDIPEGFFEVEYNGRRDYLPFPKFASSWYHWTKVHDSNNLMFASKVWNLSVTDVMQGVVYGTRTPEIVETGLYTRFDVDEVFGTALNRFCAQAIANLPITPYGKGGQTRGFISLEDSVQCLTLLAENPPDRGEYRVFNQFDEHYSVLKLATIVKEVYEEEFGGIAEIKHVENPRVEKEEHYYNPIHENLKKLGFRRTKELRDEVELMLQDLSQFRDKILSMREVIEPRTFWKESRGLVQGEKVVEES
ncbi:NAD-dependent dehydratase [Thermogymnomonas acidicola]|uniref:NAD-dependent dehydratase n=1 Tax=Thermogymnomonas acidicola TaxID=399579 RepID=A0AA37BPL5_9ARCH|nr:UDP-sulfoquinovose synthase [Thermogymnomonas acidicola]GGM66780.1 NAD-dependent dehydratase [Thermogymnomonas acidicola]